MKFLELNKKRHAVKTFNDKAVDYKDLRTAIEIATLAPSANNIQPWKFVVVEDKKAELAEHLPEINKKASRASSIRCSNFYRYRFGSTFSQNCSYWCQVIE